MTQEQLGWKRFAETCTGIFREELRREMPVRKRPKAA